MIKKLGETALSRRKSGFPQIRDLNSRNSASCGACSFSVDLTADLISRHWRKSAARPLPRKPIRGTTQEES
ncbi:MAG: hypothetical protein IKO52_16380 [Clostridia bacterium]|nr:hypothetical protein [Clostridia bacterium]